MKLFSCHNCRQILFFENTLCERCGLNVGFLPDSEQLVALVARDGGWQAFNAELGRYRFCANLQGASCNWLIEDDDAQSLCRACQHNRTIPDLSDPHKLVLWQRMERAKRQLIYMLLKLKVPLPVPGAGDPKPLQFDFLSQQAYGALPATGHDKGIITIALAEADDTERERMRSGMGEPYRTLLGHFRHEIGHFYWERLVLDAGRLDSFRALFGDERQDYAQSLQRYYAFGAPAGYAETYISAYATAHPWEDFAETWAHYLHMLDTLEMAQSFGISLAPQVPLSEGLTTHMNLAPLQAAHIQELIDAWLPLTLAINSLNRAMGQPDLYPFVISPSIVTKLSYVHDLVHH
jgi:hypothetical protein